MRNIEGEEEESEETKEGKGMRCIFGRRRTRGRMRDSSLHIERNIEARQNFVKAVSAK